MDVMTSLIVQIERFVDDHQPGWVECVLLDAQGDRHAFIEKGPVVSPANLLAHSAYPQQGSLACVIKKEWVDENGRRLVIVDTEQPWGIESTLGESVFTVMEAQLDR
jgi:hypothetical protein